MGNRVRRPARHAAGASIELTSGLSGIGDRLEEQDDTQREDDRRQQDPERVCPESCPADSQQEAQPEARRVGGVSDAGQAVDLGSVGKKRSSITSRAALARFLFR